MKNLLRNSFAVLAMALAIAACNPNGMNDRKEGSEEEHSTVEEHSMDTMTVQDTMKGTGSGMGSGEMSMQDTTKK